MTEGVRTSDLFSLVDGYLRPLFDGAEYPWEMIPKIKEYTEKLLREGIESYTEWQEGVLVGEGVKIAKSVTVIPPAVIGSGSELRPGAFLRGDVLISENCVIGNSCELKNCILLKGAQVPHYNYVGDSILGSRAHLGAGAVCSNLKADKAAVVIHGEEDYPTGLKKLGGILGDGADVGCGCVLNPGTVIGKNTSVYPLVALRGVYPQGCIVKSQKEWARRMERR